MLKDFVPARTNALTGITIKSSVLERNKIPVYQPKVTEEIIYDAEYNAPIISEDKDYYYNELEGNKSSFYTGQITGSYVNVYSYFDDEHINPYLHPTESIDINKFNHTDFNITLNNVSSSIISSVRKKVEPLYTTINNIVFNTSSTEYEYISSAELQDSNLNLQGHKNSRYEGTKLSSLRLNSYSSASAVYDGDISYGKDPVINHNTRKLGLFTQIQQNLFLPYPQQNNVFLKYLVDENGNLTELNKKNKNWEEVQNIFKSGDILTVSQFDNSKNSDTSNASQKFTDGEKLIYNSGYSYSPILYNSNDNELYFNYTGDTLSKQFQIRLKGGFISGSTPGTETYPIVNGKIFKAVDKAINDPDNVLYRDGNAYYNNLGNNTFSTYSIQENGFQKFNFNFSIQVQFQSTNQSGSFYAAIKEVEGPTLITQSIFVASGIRTTENTGLQYAKKIGIPYDFSNVAVYNNAGTLIETFPPNTTLVSISAGNVLDSSCNIIDAESGNDYYITEYDESILPSFPNCSDIFQIPNSTKLYTFPVSNLISTLDFTLDSDYKSFNSGQKIAFELTTGSVAFTTNNFTASIIPYDNANNGVIRSQMQINQIGVNPFAINDNGNKPFISGSLMGSNSIILNSSLTGFKDYLFLPSGSGFPKNKLYDKYSDALYTFSPKKGDLIILYYGPSNSLYQSEISDVNILNRKLTFQLNSDLPSILNKPVYSNSDISQFIFLTKVKDETNVLLQFDKKGGETSIGFIIPNNIHPDVLDNIDTITKEVKQKLIDYGVTNPNF